MNRLGLVTIGQAPRDDVTPEVLAHFTNTPEVIEVGALDGYEDAAAVEADIGVDGDEPLYVTRMTDGTAVRVRQHAVYELIGERLRELETEVDVIGLLCTGSFPEYDVAVPVLAPSDLLHAWARAIDPETVAVLMPDAKQEAQTMDKWGDDFEVVPIAVDPYDEETSFEAAGEEIPAEADLVVMDCIGYTESMRRTIREAADTPVLLGRSVLAKTAEEVL